MDKISTNRFLLDQKNRIPQMIQITLLKVSVSGLERLLDKPWHICASNATTGEGLQEGIEWLTGEQDT